jgi:hypothetical protein
MTSQIYTPRSGYIVTGFKIQKRIDDVWTNLSIHPGTIEQAVEHAERAYSGELRAMLDGVVVWEREAPAE